MIIINEIGEVIANLARSVSKSEYTYLILLSILTLILVSLIKRALAKYYISNKENTRERYEYNYKTKIILNTISIIALFIIWEGHFSSIVTVISFASAGVTIALREIIFNYFAGIYIRIKKPFTIEDRIEVDGIKGDIVSMNPLNFEVIEVGDRINGEQSSGIIVSFPNSYVLTMPLKNYMKEFKYIWNEITIKVPITADVESIKKEIYEIVKTNEILKKVPKKMKSQMGGISLNYHIYFNNLEPIIYTKIIADHVELYTRYLVNPRKARYVEDSLWNQIILAYQNKKIDLFLSSKPEEEKTKQE
ncbi:MAG: mechanosensitive ion channel family protein [Ignavibacteriales bacterium]